MAKRELDPRLKKLFNENKKVYSISKANTIDECLFEAYNTYILHKKGVNGIYGVLGTKIHDKLQEVMDGTAAETELPDVLNQELLDLSMLGIEFPKDFKGNDTIRDNWIADMRHFCNTFKAPKGKFTTEELVIYPLSGERYVQGYIDLIRENSDGTISIYDWKTSTNFKAGDLLHHGRQLIFYALAKEHDGFRVRDVSWIMLKYCEVSFMGKKRANAKEETKITKVINRGKLIQELRNYIEYDLNKLGYDELDIEFMIKTALDNNSFDGLPEEVRAKYKVRPYVRKYDLTDELKAEAINYLNDMADRFESLDPDDESQWPHRSFVKISRSGKESPDTFFCNSLCNFRNTCVHIKRFNEQQMLLKQETDEDADLF